MEEEIEKFCEMFDNEMDACETSYYSIRNKRREVDMILKKIGNSGLDNNTKNNLISKLNDSKKKFKNIVEDIQEDLIVTVHNA